MRRPRRPPLPIPRPPPPPPTGEARTAVQVGAELEEVGRRTARIWARIEAQLDPLNDRILKLNSRHQALGARIAKLAEGSPALAPLEAERALVMKELTGVAGRAGTLHKRRVTVGAARRNTLQTMVARPVAERNLGTFPNRASKAPLGGWIGPGGVKHAGTQPSRHAVRERGVANFRALVAKNWLTAPDGRPIRVSLLSTKRNRSFFDRGPVRLSRHAGEHTVVHELGHAVEWYHPEVLRASLRFYNRRTAGEAAQRLRILRPAANYDFHEMTRVDAFIDAYVGREYGRQFTEILSMGLEYMSRDPLEFWQKDPDHFAYIWDIMRGIVPQ